MTLPLYTPASAGGFFPGGRSQIVLAGPGEPAGLPERAWHLSTGDEGVVVAEGWANIDTPETAHIWWQSSRQDGATWLGANTEPREFDLPVHILGTDRRSWEGIYDDFLTDIDPEHLSTLYIINRTGYLELEVRQGDGAIAHEYVADPLLGEAESFVIPLVAEAPYYSGIEEVVTWSPGRTSRSIRNRGDRKVWPLYIVKGPGIAQIPDGDGNVITLPELTGSQVARVDTDPDERRMIVNDGEKVWPLIGPQRFRKPVAGNSRHDLTALRMLEANSASSITCIIRPKSRRPWRGNGY